MLKKSQEGFFPLGSTKKLDFGILILCGVGKFETKIFTRQSCLVLLILRNFLLCVHNFYKWNCIHTKFRKISLLRPGFIEKQINTWI